MLCKTARSPHSCSLRLPCPNHLITCNPTIHLTLTPVTFSARSFATSFSHLKMCLTKSSVRYVPCRWDHQGSWKKSFCYVTPRLGTIRERYYATLFRGPATCKDTQRNTSKDLTNHRTKGSSNSTTSLLLVLTFINFQTEQTYNVLAHCCEVSLFGTHRKFRYFMVTEQFVKSYHNVEQDQRLNSGQTDILQWPGEWILTKMSRWKHSTPVQTLIQDCDFAGELADLKSKSGRVL